MVVLVVVGISLFSCVIMYALCCCSAPKTPEEIAQRDEEQIESMRLYYKPKKEKAKKE